MVTGNNLETLPALDLFPEPNAGYYRTGDEATSQKSPEVLKVSFAEEPPSWDSLSSERQETPPAQPGYYLQKVYKKPMSVSTHALHWWKHAIEHCKCLWCDESYYHTEIKVIMQELQLLVVQVNAGIKDVYQTGIY